MRTSYWERIAASGFALPGDYPLEELTHELTAMLGSPDAHLRQDLAVTTLEAWIAEGIYDKVLAQFGNDLAKSLVIGLGTDGSASVFRRSYNARALGACMRRDAVVRSLDVATLRSWATRLASWFVQEVDLRGFIRSHGWAHALPNGSSALAAFAAHPQCHPTELAGLLDVISDRLYVNTSYAFRVADLDALAGLTVAVWERDSLDTALSEAWLKHIVGTTRLRDRHGEPAIMAGNAEGFLRALHLAASLSNKHFPHRSDLMLALLDALRQSNRQNPL